MRSSEQTDVTNPIGPEIFLHPSESPITKPFDPLTGSIVFSVPEFPNVMEIRRNGDIYIKGQLTSNDQLVYQTLRSWLESTCRRPYGPQG